MTPNVAPKQLLKYQQKTTVFQKTTKKWVALQVLNVGKC